VLDGLFASDLTTFFFNAAMQAVERFGVATRQMHLDSSSFAVTGEYVVEAAVAPVPEGVEDTPSGDDLQPITICRGYSRDHRPDLKQYMLNLVCSRDGGVPFWLKVASGNQSDSQTFAGVVTEFARQWDLDAMFVIDAAFYSEPNLQQVSSLRWLSRVPQTLSAAKDLIGPSTDELTAVDCPLKDYQMWETTANYGGIEQRWILIESQTRKADAALWEKEVERLERRLNRELKQLQKTVFACRPDVCEALIQFQAQLEKHQLIKLRIAPVQTKHQPGAKYHQLRVHGHFW
jgi:transposase